MQSHSIFFDNLLDRGHVLTYIHAESGELTLMKFGEYLFDNIIFFAPSVEELSSIAFEDILDFTNNGGNLLLAINGKMSDSVRSFAESCGVEFDSRGTFVIDHFSHDSNTDSR